MKQRIAVIGAGNIGVAISNGFLESGQVLPEQLILTRRRLSKLDAMKEKGVTVSDDNVKALEWANILLICVEPQQVDQLFETIAPVLDPDRHLIISVVSGLKISQLRALAGETIEIVRAMPNTATGIRQSMTCLASDQSYKPGLETAESLFNLVGRCLVIQEEKMSSATALAACGIAFFLRMIRAASQGGIEIGFHPETALLMAAQTALGASSLLLEQNNHPEYEIDRVTTPRGCTISGLNQMEHEGLSSAIIKGIVTSSTKASGLYRGD